MLCFYVTNNGKNLYFELFHVGARTAIRRYENGKPAMRYISGKAKLFWLMREIRKAET